MSIYLGDKLISGVATPIEPTRNIGQIIPSLLPLTDAGLHLLDGALIDGNGIYKAFVDHVANLYNAESPVITQKIIKNQYIALPTFTANTTNGITISDSRSNTTILQQIFNGTNSYNQIGAWSTYWVNIDYGQNTIIDSYEITSDNAGSPEYPSAWTLQASVDGSNWDVLDTKTGITFNINQKRTFYINANSAYKQYRLVFTDGVLSSSNGELQRLNFNAYTPKVVPTIEGTFFASEEQWQESVTDYSVCAKFVYDSSAKTVRLPKVTGFVAGTLDASALGSLVEAGLPNITGTLNGACITSTEGGTQSGALYLDSSQTDARGADTQGSTKSQLVGFDASRSNPIYGNSDTVTPQHIKGYMYIVIATTTKTDVEVDIDNVTTDLNGKADRDLTNVVGAMSESAKNYFSGAGMPSNSYVDLALGASGNTYTAPANGWFTVSGRPQASNAGVAFVNNNTSLSYTSRVAAANSLVSVSAPVKNGEDITCNYDGTFAVTIFRFIYAEGEQ